MSYWKLWRNQEQVLSKGARKANACNGIDSLFQNMNKNFDFERSLLDEQFCALHKLTAILGN